MFNTGELVVYGKTGVCRVDGLCEKELARNDKRNYYILKPLNTENSVIYAPVDSNKVYMQPIMSKVQADELILRIPEITENFGDKNLSREEYEEIISSHSCEGLVCLTFKLYNKKKTALENRKKPGFVDERYMALAEKLLFGELAAALEIPVDSVKEYISEKIK